MFGRESCMRSELHFRMETLLEEVTANLAFWIFSALHGAAQIFIMFHVISSNVYIFNRSNNSESSFYTNSPSLLSRNAFWKIELSNWGMIGWWGSPRQPYSWTRTFSTNTIKCCQISSLYASKTWADSVKLAWGHTHKTNNRSGMNPGDLMAPSSLPWGAYWFIAKKWMIVMVHPFEESSSTFYRSNSDLKYLVLWRKKEFSELKRAENSGKLNIWGIADKKRRVSHERFTKILYHKGVFFYIYLFSYDKLNYICIFICSYLWSIGEQMRINDIPINNV